MGMGGADLRFLSAQPDTSLHCQTTDMGLVHRTCACYASAIAGTHCAYRGGMARLSSLLWLVTYRDGYLTADGHPSKY